MFTINSNGAVYGLFYTCYLLTFIKLEICFVIAFLEEIAATMAAATIQ